MLTVRYIGELNLKAGDRVWLSPDPTRLHRFDKDGGAISEVSNGDQNCGPAGFFSAALTIGSSQ